MLKESRWIFMDDKMVPWQEANVHVLTHSLHYGMAVFEGIRAYKGTDGTHIFRLAEHTERLLSSARVMQMGGDFTLKGVMDATSRVVVENGLDSCYIRPIIFIGYGDMGIYAKKNPVRLSIAAWEWGTYLGEEGLARGIRAKVSSYTRFGTNTFLARAKVSAHYVNSQLAKWEVKGAGYDEAILLDSAGMVAEGPGANIFIVKKGVLKTPPLRSVLAVIGAKDVAEPVHEKKGALRKGTRPVRRGRPAFGLFCDSRGGRPFDEVPWVFAG